jgi:hypothetical protein
MDQDGHPDCDPKQVRGIVRAKVPRFARDDTFFFINCFEPTHRVRSNKIVIPSEARDLYAVLGLNDTFASPLQCAPLHERIAR